MKRIVVLISGRGSNMRALLEANLAGTIVAVISNRSDAEGLSIAQTHGVTASVVDHRQYADRAAFDLALAASIGRHAPDVVALAGFMRVLTPEFIAKFEHRLLNIHPSLLPAFPGLHTHRRALAAGVRIHGCTVHFVTAHVDGGPIIAQVAVPVLAGDTEASLAARVLEQEHRIYPQAVNWFCQERIKMLSDGQVRVEGAAAHTSCLQSPAPDVRDSQRR